jgi:hypothetical protein
MSGASSTPAKLSNKNGKKKVKRMGLSSQSHPGEPAAAREKTRAKPEAKMCNTVRPANVNSHRQSIHAFLIGTPFPDG